MVQIKEEIYALIVTSLFIFNGCRSLISLKPLIIGETTMTSVNADTVMFDFAMIEIKVNGEAIVSPIASPQKASTAQIFFKLAIHPSKKVRIIFSKIHLIDSLNQKIIPRINLGYAGLYEKDTLVVDDEEKKEIYLDFYSRNKFIHLPAKLHLDTLEFVDTKEPVPIEDIIFTKVQY